MNFELNFKIDFLEACSSTCTRRFHEAMRLPSTTTTDANVDYKSDGELAHQFTVR